MALPCIDTPLRVYRSTNHDHPSLFYVLKEHTRPWIYEIIWPRKQNVSIDARIHTGVKGDARCFTITYHNIDDNTMWLINIVCYNVIQLISKLWAPFTEIHKKYYEYQKGICIAFCENLGVFKYYQPRKNMFLNLIKNAFMHERDWSYEGVPL